MSPSAALTTSGLSAADQRLVARAREWLSIRMRRLEAAVEQLATASEEHAADHRAVLDHRRECSICWSVGQGSPCPIGSRLEARVELALLAYHAARSEIERI